uniref:Uncharacterized protein n=1 Tax=Pseudictyota dubia TaxID=2749911 RepID=A0A7R9ZCS3_9STRA|mmetsp:Transcript_38718/g.71570  ORF Transcript_38718/g.71570 Transcript_38718/m.71570 type:complete len:139 (+) Transcript_38718:107-523(+)
MAVAVGSCATVRLSATVPRNVAIVVVMSSRLPLLFEPTKTTTRKVVDDTASAGDGRGGDGKESTGYIPPIEPATSASTSSIGQDNGTPTTHLRGGQKKKGDDSLRYNPNDLDSHVASHRGRPETRRTRSGADGGRSRR